MDFARVKMSFKVSNYPFLQCPVCVTVIANLGLLLSWLFTVLIRSQYKLIVPLYMFNAMLVSWL